MSWFSSFFGDTARGIIEGVHKIVDEFHLSGEEKQQFVLAAEKLVTDRFMAAEESARSSINARMQVIVAEINQGDLYTKRTRPMIARWGLYTIMYNYAGVPTLTSAAKFLGGLLDNAALIAMEAQPFSLPTEFWYAWGGIVGTYAIGRSFEKGGVMQNIAKHMTGGEEMASTISKRLVG